MNQIAPQVMGVYGFLLNAVLALPPSARAAPG